MPTRINVNNDMLPGVQSEVVMRMGNENARRAIFRDEEYLGEIVYVERTVANGTLYGWRPAQAPAQSKLTNKVDAVRRLPRF